MYLIFDTETTGLPNAKLAPDHPDQSRVCQLACLLLDENFKRMATFCSLIEPDNWIMSPGAQQAHGITLEQCQEYGIPMVDAFAIFERLSDNTDMLVAHNIKFDLQMMDIEAALLSKPTVLANGPETVCTMMATTNLCKLPGRYPGSFKWPKLHEAYSVLLKKELKGAHDAMVDVNATAEILQWLVENKHCTRRS